ncbi:MAG: autotransporter domain-containing protein [Allosphingosinicella sp.]|uniref:autotransporter domain-containing protein n=1 Tax=Allosphingosinicella sp. TaxID=2823234 RepID=UPI00395AE85F
MRSTRFAVVRRSLLTATGILLTAGVASAATAADRPTGSEESPGIVIRNDLNPNTLPPSGILDSGITGVGQMTIRGNPATTGMNLCTGTLINPRTVIFAAHCVNTRPADVYGVNGTPFGPHTGGTPIAFGFNADNLPAVRLWLGLSSGDGEAANPALLHKTNLARALYAVEQVWWDPRSLNPGSSGFLTADIAIATLDTPAFDIPTWAVLFSPLDGPTNALQIGYGNAGRENQGASGTPGGIAIDWRRRTAENIISLLGSLDDRNQWLFGSGSVVNNLYMLSFNDPNPAYNPAAGKFDFGLFGGPERGDPVRPREGTTAGGDSGGPLVVEDKYDRQVVAGVLSGGSRFFAAQQFHSYGSHSFYQPLHAYWETIVANNPYVYAGNKGGNGNWEDANHWVQLMDPNYMIDVNGQLVNGLPNTPEEGVSGSGAKWGYICFLDDCTQLDQAAPTGTGSYIVVPGGPGSTNFVPNNRVANPSQGIKARYYDVTLAAPGITTLSSAVTIDRMTLDGQTRLDVRQGGSLRVLGEYNQLNGWTNVDGLVHSGRDALVLSGLLSGSGTFRAPYVTVVGGIVAPGGADRIGTLTVDGNLVMSSASALFIDANRQAADRLAVTGAASLGGSLVMNKAQGAAPKHGDSFVILTANGGVTGTFGQIYAFQGVLRPELTYGPNSVTANLRAGSLANQIGQSGPTEQAFARALDQLRGNYYHQLGSLYASIDLMDSATLSRTLRGLAPDIATENRVLQERQSRVLLNTISDRLSSLGTASGGHLSVNGSGAMLQSLAEGRPSPTLGFQSMVPSQASAKVLPEGMTGFVSSGYTTGGSTIGDSRAGIGGGQHSVHVGMGLEMEMAPGLTVGSAFGYADGFSAAGALQGRTEARTTQAAVYGSYQLGGGAYVAGLASAENSRTTMQRSASTGEIAFDLYGATATQRYTAMAEAGVNLTAAPGLTVTPRAQLGYSSYHLGGFRENGGDLALHLDDLKLQRLDARMGARVAGSASVAGWTVEPQLTADLVSTLSGANDGMAVRFANAAGHTFYLPIANGDRMWGEVRGGLKMTSGRLSFGAGVESSIGRSDLRDDRAVADFTIRF